VHYLDWKNIIYMVLLDATPCNLLDLHSCPKKNDFSIFCLTDGSNKFLQTVDNFLPNCTASYCGRRCS